MRFSFDTSYRQSLQLLRHPEQRASYGLLLLMLIVAPLVLPRFYVGELSYLFLMCIASLGLMMLTGFTGQVSLGHAAFMAIGAYAHAWMLAQGVPWLLCVVCAMAIAAAAGVVVGLPAIRISGLYLAMATLAFSFIVAHFAGRWDSVTGGHGGMAVGELRILGVDFEQPVPFYFLCLAILLLVLWGLLNLVRSPLGRAFVGVRDSEAAAHALGIHVSRIKIAAFVLSAALCGLSGALLSHHLKYLTPEAFDMMTSLQLVLMVVIGGLGSLRGAIFGGILIGLLPSLISAAKPFLPDHVASQFGLDVFVFGLVLTLFVLFEPKGMNGRWLRVRAWLETFPTYRRDNVRRGKTYMRSERYR